MYHEVSSIQEDEEKRRLNAPFGHLLEVDAIARQPNPKRVAPFREEFGFEELTEHGRPQQRLPCEDGLDRCHILLARVDDERSAEESAELGQDVLEDE